MMITLVSQCEKNALAKTRRVLDAFANRIGDNTWQTLITKEGLDTVHKMLRQTASKSTAVSCHWIRSRSRVQLLWVVGRKSAFNGEGVVPVNYTEKDITMFKDNAQWKTLDTIIYAASIAGLFHDFGKANVLFQQKLQPENTATKQSEPYRHEWVSLRLFQAFVSNNQNDQEWLNKLSEVEKNQSVECFKDGICGTAEDAEDNRPITDLPPFAQLVAWLIVSHHRLPLVPSWKNGINKAEFQHINTWLESNFEAIWNSYNCKDHPDLKSVIQDNWNFKKGLPYQSPQWRSQACMLASPAQRKLTQINQLDFLHDHIFTAHLARLSLMLADHFYSSQQPTAEWQNLHYEVYANTDRKTKALKQQLDEHCIGVAIHAKDIAKALPKLNYSLPQLADNAELKDKVEKENEALFGWQDKAQNLASNLSEASIKQGFFGINMASTGKGKTRANAKIMVALGEQTGRRRFSVALGLRSLTLQTGREYQNKLKLSNEELAIAVGGIAVKQLFEQQQKESTKSENADTGSESQEDYLDPNLFVDYLGTLDRHSLSKWTKGRDKNRIDKLLQAPVLVCTIDHLIPATEGTRGGRQIAPMLRLLTSDLIIDEPDDFGLDDLPALCRLVHWAGMLGSRVLFSTATMPPALAYAAFQAYQKGWSQYAKANLTDWNEQIQCAWFDEKNTAEAVVKDFENDFKKTHEKFICNRISYLQSQPHKHRAEILAVTQQNGDSVYQTYARTIQQGALDLHQQHKQTLEGKQISIGLVRMANINPLVAVAKELLALPIDKQKGTIIHLCVYHSRFPLAIRSHLESELDSVLKRKDSNWPPQSITDKLEHSDKQNHIFIVLASPVAEVGRDHDYDWAIIEPSSMRSIIQIAGRILRHRNITPKHPNILLLDKNIKCLKGEKPCFERPGFEIKKLQLQMNSHDLQTVLQTEQYETVNSIQRIKAPIGFQQNSNTNLVALEHHALHQQLFSSKKSAKNKDPKPAKVWWQNSPHWCGEVQKQQRFRQSDKDEAVYLVVQDNGTVDWQWKNENVYPPEFGDISGVGISINEEDTTIAQETDFWFDLQAVTIYKQLAESFKINTGEVSKRFGEVRLVTYSNDALEYRYHCNLGLYKK